MSDKGKVFLVGAGPGEPGLITVKGAKILAECDAVVYDRLVPMELVSTLPPATERYYVGKSAGRHSLKQEEINRLLVELAERGMKVVRLKGGDPFVFGRGGEEALFLKSKGIPFEVAPGVTSGLAATAYAGIPVTHREKSVFTVFLTAHEAQGKAESQIPWDWLSRVKNGTIVGYMGVKRLADVTEKLISAGMSAQTPVALIERGATGLQKSITGRLEEAPLLAEKAGILPPALFVIGDVVALADEIKWSVKKTLSGKRVMVTRPSDQGEGLYSLLREYGAEILPLPTIATSAYFDRQGWDEFKEHFSGRHISARDNWLVFTSENGVRYFLNRLPEVGLDYRAMGDFKIAVVGTGTCQVLKRYGFNADFIPSKATTAIFAQEFSDIIADKVEYIVRVRGNLGDNTVERTLESAGRKVLPLQVYNTFTPEWDSGMWALLEENPPDIITFTSGSTVNGFFQILGAEQALALAKTAIIASIGPVTSQILRDNGVNVHIEASEHSIPGLVEAILDYFN